MNAPTPYQQMTTHSKEDGKSQLYQDFLNKKKNLTNITKAYQAIIEHAWNFSHNNVKAIYFVIW